MTLPQHLAFLSFIVPATALPPLSLHRSRNICLIHFPCLFLWIRQLSLLKKREKRIMEKETFSNDVYLFKCHIPTLPPPHLKYRHVHTHETPKVSVEGNISAIGLLN